MWNMFNWWIFSNLHRSLVIDPKATVYQSLAGLYYNINKLRESYNMFKKGLEMEPNNTNILCSFVSLYTIITNYWFFIGTCGTWPGGDRRLRKTSTNSSRLILSSLQPCGHSSQRQKESRQGFNEIALYSYIELAIITLWRHSLLSVSTCVCVLLVYLNLIITKVCVYVMVLW